MSVKVESRKIDGETWFKFNDNFDRIKYYYGNLLTALFIIVLVVLGASLLYYMNSNMEELKANPFTYAANKMRGDVYCSCQEYRDGKTFLFEFDKTSWWNTNQGTERPINTNFSEGIETVIPKG